MEKTEAPWNDKQVKSLNGYQRSGVMHPFTCGGDHDEHIILVADNDGWWCPTQTCDYKQSWAWDFMSEEEWREAKTQIDRLFGTPENT